VDVELNHVLSEGVTDPTNVEEIATADGVIIPGGFDERGVGGKISTAEYARRHDIPTLGLCLGFQVMVIEYARNVCGLTQAHSTEFDDSTPHPVIAVMPEQYDVEELGGTMRLGSYTATVKEGTLAESLYGESVSGRHRHRYEVNPEYIERLESPDTHLRFSAQMNNRMEIVELDNAAFYFGTQFHPEYGSRPTDPRPAYVEFLRAARRQ
jgi:CTP synthase